MLSLGYSRLLSLPRVVSLKCSRNKRKPRLEFKGTTISEIAAN